MSGKADPQGRRQGSVSAMSVDTALYRRFSDHARSIESVDNLDLNDFRCRWLKLDPVWIGLTEQVLIAQYRPLWNVVVDGFGNHDPGGGRRNQRRSQWDTLHPGRGWASNLRDREETATEVINAVIAHRFQRLANIDKVRTVQVLVDVLQKRASKAHRDWRGTLGSHSQTACAKRTCAFPVSEDSPP